MRSWSKIPWHPRDPPPNRSSLKIYITVVLFRHQIEFRSAVTSFLASYRVAGEIAEAPSIFVPGLQSQDSNPYPILFLANWSPGSPPLWSPPPLPLSSSNRHHRRRRRIRTYHQTTQVSAYLPFFASLRIMQPDYCFRSICLVTSCNSIRKLFMLTYTAHKDAFRFLGASRWRLWVTRHDILQG